VGSWTSQPAIHGTHVTLAQPLDLRPTAAATAARLAIERSRDSAGVASALLAHPS